MKKSTYTHRILPLTFLALGAGPAGLAAHVSPALAAAAQAAKSRSFTGQIEYVDHGPVRVKIVVRSKKIVGVSTWNSPEDNRSVVLQGNALPLLRQETLRAQSASISIVSGATDTSYGYIGSLQNAIAQARHARVLK